MYTLKFSKADTVGEIERANASKVRLYRHDAAKIFKISQDAGKQIHKLRLSYKSKEKCMITLVDKKYDFSFPYFSDNIAEKSIVLKRYRDHIHNIRKELKYIVTNFSPTGFCQNQKIHLTANGIMNLYYKTILKRPKLPQTVDAHIGIEIELGFPTNVVYEKLMPFGKQISLIGDASINGLPAGYKAEEVRILTTEANYREDLLKICTALNEMKAIVNKSCGLHIHLDMRGQEKEVIEKRFINLVRSQRYLQGMVKEERRNAHYCKPTRYLNPWEQADRYHAINARALSKYNTIEIRLHHGTLDITEIVNWITTLLAISKAELLKKIPETLEKFVKKIVVDAEMKKYIEDKTSSYTPVVEVAENVPAIPPITTDISTNEVYNTTPWQSQVQVNPLYQNYVVYTPMPGNQNRIEGILNV